MLSSEKLGVIAFLNDRPEALLSQILRSLSPEVLDHVLEVFLSGTPLTLSREEAFALKVLQDRPLDKDLLYRTMGRVKESIDQNVEIVTIWDSAYPNGLRLIPNAPLLLFVKGARFPGESRVAIAGSKGASKKGLAAAYEFGAKLAKQGHTIVSGLGKGTEVEAHNGCLSSGGTSLAILGTPVTEIYPKDSESLAQEVQHHGALVSDITAEAPLYPGRIYHRYRIASGISDCLVVVEATEETVFRQADIAFKQGRKVFAVDRDNHGSQDHRDGVRRLRKLGAISIMYPEDVKVTMPKQLKLF